MRGVSPGFEPVVSAPDICSLYAGMSLMHGLVRICVDSEFPIYEDEPYLQIGLKATDAHPAHGDEPCAILHLVAERLL